MGTPLEKASELIYKDIDGDGERDIIDFTPVLNEQGAWVVKKQIIYGGRDSDNNGIKDILQDGFSNHEESFIIPARISLYQTYKVGSNGVDTPPLIRTAQSMDIQFEDYGEDVRLYGDIPLTTINPAPYKKIDVFREIN